ncbi:MAG: S9 family peptidase, partial [Elusimicrobiota bacterium]
EWSPDSLTIAVTRSGDGQRGELLLVDVAGGMKREIPAPVPGGIIFPQKFSADGKFLLCAALNAGGFMQLYWLDLALGRGEFIGPDHWDVQDVSYRSKTGIVFTLNEGGSSAIYRLMSPKAKPERLLKADGYIEHLDLNETGSTLAYVWSNSTHPQDIWFLSLKTSKKSGPLIQFLTSGIEPELMSRAVFIRYPSFDGRLIPALYLKPMVNRLGSPAPLVVIAHGGPDYQIVDEFDPQRQAFAQAGFAVLAPNFRGSTGYGKEFMDLDNKDWGGGDLQDLIWGARFLASRGEIDERRAGITGVSFGGYLTLMALAKSSGVWSAGVEGFGMPDLKLDYELSKNGFGDWYATEMGTPQTEPGLFRDRSPINFIDQIRSPLLIFHGARDTNVPKEESELIYSELKNRGRSVELVMYPDEGHEFTKRNNRIDYYGRTLDFFLKRLASESPGP